MTTATETCPRCRGEGEQMLCLDCQKTFCECRLENGICRECEMAAWVKQQQAEDEAAGQAEDARHMRAAKKHARVWS